MILDCPESWYPLFDTIMCGCQSHISNYEPSPAAYLYLEERHSYRYDDTDLSLITVTQDAVILKRNTITLSSHR
jgi:hypothetical protein